MTLSCPPRRALGLTLAVAFAAALAGCTLESTGPASGGSSSGGSSSGGSSSGGSSGEVAAECLSGGPSTVVDGWSRATKADFVEMKGGALRAELHYSFPLDDALRAGDTTLNVWDRLLGSRYQAAGERATGGEGPGFTRYGYGAAVEKATGKNVYIAITPEIANGTAHPVVVIAPSQSALQKVLPDEKAVAALQRYNFMPLECQTISGDWTSSFTSAAETYSATGSYTGLAVSAASVDLSVRGEAYSMRKRAYVNGQSSDVTDTGAVAAAGNALVLRSDQGVETTYDAGLVAVRGGYALYVVNRQYSGDRTLLFRR
jgi:hypothetical protein